MTKADLPNLGDWDGPIYGELGVVEVEPDGERVRCHACGRWYRFLASHVTQAHHLTADEYRAIFGLKTRTGLMSPTMKERRREQAAPILRQFAGMGLAAIHALPDEERRAINRGRRWRLEGRLDPRNRQLWQEKVGKNGPATRAWRERLRDPAFKARWARRLSVVQGGPVFATCTVCGKPIRMKPSNAARARWHACDAACLRLLRRELVAELARKLTEAKGGRVTVTCVICGRSRDVTRSAANGSREHLCSRDGPCLAEWQRRRVLQHNPLASPASRAKLAATERARWREKTPEERAAFAAKVSAAARRRGRAETSRLRALPPAEFEALPARDREIVVRYFGLDGCTPSTAAELAAALGVSTRPVRDSLARSLRSLLG